MSDKYFGEEENYQEFDEKEMKVNEKDKLDINSCEEKSTSKKIKSHIDKNIKPNLSRMSDSNSFIMNELEDLIYKIVNQETSFKNINENTIDTLSDLLIRHTLIEENIEEIIRKNEKL